MKPHLLYLAFWFPPSRASGVYRALATTAAFVQAGWHVTVVTTTREFLEDEVGSTDDTLESLIPEGVDVVRVPFTFGLRAEAPDLKSVGWFRGNFPQMWQRIRQKSDPLRSTVALLMGKTPAAYQFTDNYTAWIDPVVKIGRRVNSEREIAHILATGNPFSSFEASRVIGGIVGVPYSVDYRDPWTIDVFTGKSDHANRLTTQAERRIIDEAAACFHVNSSIADAYSAKYPESASKQLVVYNGFDRESIPPPHRSRSKGALTFGILGTVNDRWPLEPTFQAWIDSREQLPPGSTLILGGHLGYFARSRDVLEDYLPNESLGFRYVGPVPKLQVADFYSSLDVVVVPVPGGPMVTSGKIFEAMALGIPIVCIQTANGGARQLISDHPLAFGAEPEASAVQQAILDAAEATRTLDPSLSQTLVDNALSYERAAAMAGLVDAVTATNPQGQPA